MKTVQYAFAAAILLCLTFLSANVFAQQNNRSGANPTPIQAPRQKIITQTPTIVEAIRKEKL